MSSHKHTPGTPGKWFVGQKVRDGSICVVGDIDSVVCEFGERLGGVEADARLIAAAPDSHEANVMFVEAMDRFFGIESYWNDDLIFAEMPSSELAAAYFAARAAIAKATGESA